MEKQSDTFYCYSPLLMHYLKACGLSYIREGYNAKSKSPYFMFERCPKLENALNGWEEFKRKQMEMLENAE